jgi:hypothetical protein
MYFSVIRLFDAPVAYAIECDKVCLPYATIHMRENTVVKQVYKLKDIISTPARCETKKDSICSYSTSSIDLK